MSSVLTRTGRKIHEYFGAKKSKDLALEKRLGETCKLENNMKRIKNLISSYQATLNQFCTFNDNLTKELNCFYDKDCAYRSTIQAIVDTLRSHAEIFKDQITDIKKMDPKFKEWFVGFETLKTVRQKYDHYLEKIQKLRTKKQSVQQTKGTQKENEKYARNEQKFEDAKRNYDAAIQKQNDQIDRIENNKFILVNPIIVEFISEINSSQKRLFQKYAILDGIKQEISLGDIKFKDQIEKKLQQEREQLEKEIQDKINKKGVIKDDMDIKTVQTLQNEDDAGAEDDVKAAEVDKIETRPRVNTQSVALTNKKNNESDVFSGWNNQFSNTQSNQQQQKQQSSQQNQLKKSMPSKQQTNFGEFGFADFSNFYPKQNNEQNDNNNNNNNFYENDNVNNESQFYSNFSQSLHNSNFPKQQQQQQFQQSNYPSQQQQNIMRQSFQNYSPQQYTQNRQQDMYQSVQQNQMKNQQSAFDTNFDFKLQSPQKQTQQQQQQQQQPQQSTPLKKQSSFSQQNVFDNFGNFSQQQPQQQQISNLSLYNASLQSYEQQQKQQQPKANNVTLHDMTSLQGTQGSNQQQQQAQNFNNYNNKGASFQQQQQPSQQQYNSMYQSNANYQQQLQQSNANQFQSQQNTNTATNNIVDDDYNPFK